MKAIWLGLVLTSALILYSGIAPADDATGPTTLRRVDFGYLMQNMAHRGARIATIQILSRPSDAILAKEKKAELDKIPAADQTSDEKTLLRMLNDGTIPSDSVCGYRGEKFYDITLPPRLDDPKVLAATVQQFLALDPRYEAIPCGSLTVIAPKDDPILKIKATLVVHDVPAEEAITAFSKILLPQKIMFQSIHIGPPRNDGKGEYGDTRITLNLVDRPIIELCSGIAEQLGPEYSWSMAGVEGSYRNFGFGNPIR